MRRPLWMKDCSIEEEGDASRPGQEPPTGDPRGQVGQVSPSRSPPLSYYKDFFRSPRSSHLGSPYGVPVQVPSVTHEFTVPVSYPFTSVFSVLRPLSLFMYVPPTWSPGHTSP